MILFNHHHDRAVTEYADKERSKSSDNPASIQSKFVPGKVQKLMLASTKRPKQVENEFKKLIGQPMNSDIDKKLLFGIFDIPPEKRQA